MSSSVRTRFAPSPTGYLHVGGVRTALFAWLVARAANGQFILRIEDTDQAREVAGSVDHIIESLAWLGITPDEEPVKQSQRLDVYKKWAEKLVKEGKAYADTSSPAELEELREKAKAEKRPFLFRDHRPDNPPAWDGQMPLRLKSEPKAYKWHDEVMGDLSTGPEAVDDFILMKSDGYPTYNFAHIIDDYEMQISHVIRSQEFVASMPKYLNLYEALGFGPPKLATLPYVMGEGGNKKLSKRDGAKDILDYRSAGFLPETLLNFLATLGWNDGSQQEIFSRSELIEKFDLSRVQRGGARFDEQRLLWMNGHYIREMELDDLFERFSTFWPPAAETYDEAYKKRVMELVHERLKYGAELGELTIFFFKDPAINLELVSTNKQLSKLSATELKDLLEKSYDHLKDSSFSLDDITERLNKLLEITGSKPVVLFSLIRIAVTQAPASPGLADTLAVLGKERSLERLQKTLRNL